MAQWSCTRLGPMRTRVQCLASLRGLRIRHCHELWCRSQMWHCMAVVQTNSCSSNSTPSLGTSICHGCGPKKTKKKKVHIFNFSLLISNTITIHRCNPQEPKLYRVFSPTISELNQKSIREKHLQNPQIVGNQKTHF